MYEYGFPSFKNSGTKVCACFDGRQNFQSQFQCNCLRDIPLKLTVEFRSGVSMATPLSFSLREKRVSSIALMKPFIASHCSLCHFPWKVMAK